MFSDCSVLTGTDKSRKKKSSFHKWYESTPWKICLQGHLSTLSPIKYTMLISLDISEKLMGFYATINWLEVSGQVKFRTANEWKFRLEWIVMREM